MLILLIKSLAFANLVQLPPQSIFMWRFVYDAQISHVMLIMFSRPENYHNEP
jgi:hypothetical protein